MSLQNYTYERILGKVEMETILKRIKGQKLKQTERNYLSRSIKPKLIEAKLLTDANLLIKIQKPDKSLDKKIIYNLSNYKFEMILPKRLTKQEKIPLEELIAAIITKRPKPRFIEAIPILLIKNDIDKFKLVEISCKYGIVNQLGYLIEIAMIISKKLNIKKDFNDLLRYMKNNKKKEIKQLEEETDNKYKDFLMKTSPKRIKKWNLLGRFFDDDFIKLAGAYL